MTKHSIRNLKGKNSKQLNMLKNVKIVLFFRAAINSVFVHLLFLYMSSFVFSVNGRLSDFFIDFHHSDRFSRKITKLNATKKEHANAYI